MRSAVTRRLAGGLALVLAVMTLVFIILQAAPGDPASVILGPGATAESVAKLDAQLGLDRSVLAQYADYVGGVVTGDLGDSYYGSQSVTGLIGDRLPATAWLLAAGLLISVPLSCAIALLSAHRRGTLLDRGLRAVTVVALAIPSFWLGLLLVLTIALPTEALPVGGFGDTAPEHFKSIILPGVTLAASLVPVQVRVLRAGLVQALKSEYVAAARSRGVGSVRVLVDHALPNASLPLLTIVAVQLSYALFAGVVIEQTFQLPGIGSALIEAVGERDYPVVTGITLALAVVIVLISTVSELLQMALDPRMRLA